MMFLFCILSLLSLNAVEKKIQKKLLDACKTGSQKKVWKALKQGASLCSMSHGEYPLIASIQEGHLDIAQWIIEQDVNTVTLEDAYGNTSLSAAAAWKRNTILEPLLRYGAETSYRGKNSHTPLEWCCINHNTQGAAIILKYRPDLEQQNNQGETPLIQAAKARASNIIKMLLKKKVKLETQDMYNETALTYAILKNLPIQDIASLATDKTIHISAPLCCACHMGNVEAVALLMARGAYVDEKNSTGQFPQEIIPTPLEYRYDNYNDMQLLLSDPNASRQLPRSKF